MALNNFRSTWDHTNLHLENVTGNPAKHFTGAIFAERFEAISRGRFFVGNISVTYTKGTGYRLILKANRYPNPGRPRRVAGPPAQHP